MHLNAIEGCAELYLAEMFLCKRRIYEARENLRSIIELTGEDLAHYLPLKTLTMIKVKDVSQLFFNSLTGSFTLTVSGNENKTTEIGKNEKGVKSKKTRKLFSGATGINCYLSHGSKRITSWMWQGNDDSANEETENSDKKIADTDDMTARIDEFAILDSLAAENLSGDVYRANLSAYWLGWQRDARLSGFDFDYLQTFSEARAVRF